MTCPTACLILAGAVATIGSGPARVELAQTQHGYAVTYRNTIVQSLTVTPWAVDLAGLTVTGTINAGDGDAPDDLVVTPPDGFWCDPCIQTVQEGESGTVELFPELGA